MFCLGHQDPWSQSFEREKLMTGQESWVTSWGVDTRAGSSLPGQLHSDQV